MDEETDRHVQLSTGTNMSPKAGNEREFLHRQRTNDENEYDRRVQDGLTRLSSDERRIEIDCHPNSDPMASVIAELDQLDDPAVDDCPGDNLSPEELASLSDLNEEIVSVEDRRRRHPAPTPGEWWEAQLNLLRMSKPPYQDTS